MTGNKFQLIFQEKIARIVSLNGFLCLKIVLITIHGQIVKILDSKT